LTAKEQTRRVPVYVVLPQQTMLLDVAGPLEVLRAAQREQTAVRFEVHYVGPTAEVSTSIGLTIAGIEPLPQQLPDEAMVVISGMVDYAMTPGADAMLKRSGAGDAEVVAWLRGVVRPEHKVVAICTGALLAGRAGLLAGRACTTHHACCEELAELVPDAKVLENRLYVEDGRRYTSAGVASGIDLMLYIVGQVTDDACAAAIARYLVVYVRRGGADPQLSPWLEGRNHIHPAVHRVQDAIAADPAKRWTLRGLAKIAGASSRHVTRLFQEYAGMSVTDYKNSLRVALARELLSQTNLDMERVAERAGFGSTRQLRRAWGRLYDTAPREARSR
jgi:transcriptional regulator GlxA family with amidase domain